MTKIISIEGNIGSGKSTIVKQLKECNSSNYIFVEERLMNGLLYAMKMVNVYYLIFIKIASNIVFNFK